MLEKRECINVRRLADYNTLFMALDELIAANLPQIKLYHEVGRLVSDRQKKGAAVAATKYLHSAYPDISGFSPRNLRRMREFYRTYEDAPEIMVEAMTIGWTQSVVILEAELTLQERAWYIRAVRQFGWSKLKLAEQIAASAHRDIALDLVAEVCYTEKNSVTERVNDDKHPLYLPRQHMSKSNGRVCDEGLDEEVWAGNTVPPGRDGPGQPAEYAPYLRRRLRGQNAPADRLYRPPRRCGGFLVYRRF